MEQEVYTIKEARDYLGIYEKIIYAALKSGELQGRKSGKQGNKWLIDKASLDNYKRRIERGEVETRFPLVVKKEQEVYTTKEAAQLLGIDVGRVYQARDTRIIPARTDVNGNYVLNQEDIGALRSSRYGNLEHTKEISPIVEVKQQVPTPVKVEKPAEKPNDGKLLQDILSSAFAFLSEHHFSISFKSLEEVDVALRLWVMKTPETTLTIVASGNQITVLSSEYQRQLEANFASTTEQLRKAETTLSFLRTKKREIILKEYSHDLSVWLEPRSDGFLVWCDTFPFSALGKTEEEALAAFRRVLWGYTCWLRNHQEKLTPEMQSHFAQLKNLLVEDK